MQAIGLILAFSSPFWIPLVFTAYVIGKRRFGVLALVVFITAEAISLAIFAALLRNAMPER